jgi:hypothetical protein
MYEPATKVQRKARQPEGKQDHDYRPQDSAHDSLD